jgi:hypothetical protein
MPDREKVIKALECHAKGARGCLFDCPYGNENGCQLLLCSDALALLKEQEHKDRMYHALEDDWKRLKELLKEQEADKSKYQYKYDHTDCIWYHSDEESRCPSSCSQYRDGWNDAMDYIFKDGKGYQPYIRKEGR